MVGSADMGSRMRSLVRAAADRPVWSWLAIPLLVLAACVGAFNPQAPLPLWILVAPVWACAVAADLHSTYRFGGNAARHELNPVLSSTMGRLGVKRALALHLLMYVAILAALPVSLEFVGGYHYLVHGPHHLLGIMLPALAGAHVWCTGINVQVRRGLGA